MTLARGAANKESIQIIDYPNKHEYMYGLPGSEKHKFGYEINEKAKPFHHTTTADDGVRLGCYGLELEGIKYSTQYVADARGYRPVYTHEPITVYPKTGDERKASFVGEFNESEQQSRNIRYFFPDGCKGTMSDALPKAPAAPFIRVKTDASKPPTPRRPIPPRSSVQPPPAKSYQPPAVNTIPVTLRSTNKQSFEPSPATSNIVQKNVCDVQCGDNKPRLVLPVILKNKSGQCGDFGKITVPIKGIPLESLKKLSEGGDYEDLVKSIMEDIQ